MRRIARLLLGSAAAIYAFGAAMHALAYAKSAGSRIGHSDLPPFFAAELKALWLADSTTLAVVAVLCALLAARPRAADKTAVALVAAIPAATATLIYVFLGGFYAAHMLMAASAMVFVASLLLPSRNGL